MIRPFKKGTAIVSGFSSLWMRAKKVIEVHFQFYQKMHIFFAKILEVFFPWNRHILSQLWSVNTSATKEKISWLLFYNQKNSKVKIYTYNAVKKALPKDNVQKICQIFTSRYSFQNVSYFEGLSSKRICRWSRVIDISCNQNILWFELKILVMKHV